MKKKIFHKQYKAQFLVNFLSFCYFFPVQTHFFSCRHFGKRSAEAEPEAYYGYGRGYYGYGGYGRGYGYGYGRGYGYYG